MEHISNNAPNAGRLIESLRSVGYGNYEAIADIVDNALDADATKVFIKVGSYKNDFYIHVADNGSGMDLSTLDEAMKLGSETSRDRRVDLGRFGMGLVTASLSISPCLTVVTRQAGKIHASTQDVDLIKAENAFVKRLGDATLDEESLLDSYVGAGVDGTLVILDRCDQIRSSQTTAFARTLAGHLGRVHRHFLGAGREFFINGDPVLRIDPLQLDDPGTRIDTDVDLDVTVKRPSGDTKETVRIRIAIVPAKDANEGDLKIGIRNQGFYIMRNQRELMNAITMDAFTKHNDFNRMRGEIFFPGSMDDVVGIEFTKRQIDLTQSVKDQLDKILVPNCTRIKRESVRDRSVESSAERKELHEQAVRAIADKNKLLRKPKVQRETREPGGTKGSVEPKETGKMREPRERAQLSDRVDCEFLEERMGPHGQIFECDLRGKTVVIRYNIEHPFYQRFILENVDERRMVTAADFLVYGMAAGELLLATDDEQREMVNTYKSVVSDNLRTLLN